MAFGFGPSFKDVVESFWSRARTVEFANERAWWHPVDGVIGVDRNATDTASPHQVIAADDTRHQLRLIEHCVQNGNLTVGHIEEAASTHRQVDETPWFATGPAETI